MFVWIYDKQHVRKPCLIRIKQIVYANDDHATSYSPNIAKTAIHIEQKDFLWWTPNWYAISHQSINLFPHLGHVHFCYQHILSANKLLSSSSTGKNDFRLTLKRIRTNKTRRTNKQESMNLIGLYISVSRCPVYKDDLQNLNNLRKVLTSREALDIAFSFTALATKVILQIKRTSL